MHLKISTSILIALIIFTIIFPKYFAICGILAGINGLVASVIGYVKHGRF